MALDGLEEGCLCLVAHWEAAEEAVVILVVVVVLRHCQDAQVKQVGFAAEEPPDWLEE